MEAGHELRNQNSTSGYFVLRKKTKHRTLHERDQDVTNLVKCLAFCPGLLEMQGLEE